jgi:hypothetical protein
MTEAREARKAKLIAARADRPEPTEMVVTVAAVQPGDFLLRIPAQGGLRAVLVTCTVRTAADTDEWGQRNYRGRLIPVQGRRLSLVDGRSVSRPADFKAVVRRVVAS